MNDTANAGSEAAADGGKCYHRFTVPSPWVERFAPLVSPGGSVLDLACGNGRNGRVFLTRAHPVVFVDANVSALGDLDENPVAEVLRCDLEADEPDDCWPLAGRSFAAIVGVNYLHRPLFPQLIRSLVGGGVLLYDTFARGNERFGRPRNPDHLLKPGELLALVGQELQVVAYEYGIIDDPACAGVKQRICAVRSLPGADGEPAPVRLEP